MAEQETTESESRAKGGNVTILESAIHEPGTPFHYAAAELRTRKIPLGIDITRSLVFSPELQTLHYMHSGQGENLNGFRATLEGIEDPAWDDELRARVEATFCHNRKQRLIQMAVNTEQVLESGSLPPTAVITYQEAATRYRMEADNLNAEGTNLLNGNKTLVDDSEVQQLVSGIVTNHFPDRYRQTRLF